MEDIFSGIVAEGVKACGLLFAFPGCMGKISCDTVVARPFAGMCVLPGLAACRAGYFTYMNDTPYE